MKYHIKITLMLLALAFSACAQSAKQVAVDGTTYRFIPGASTNTISSNMVAGTNIVLEIGAYGQVTINSTGGTGTVSSVGLTMPSAIFTLNNSPITSSGDIEVLLQNQTANTVWAGPTTGVAANPTFRALVAGDIPDLSGTYQPLDAQLTDLSGLSYSGNALKYLRVNAGETGFELATVSGGSGLTNTFNGNQFTLSNGTNVNFSLTPLISNVFIGGSPQLVFTNASSTSNNKKWKLGTSNTNLTLSVVSDDDGSSASVFSVFRSGASVVAFNLFPPVVVSGAITNSALTASSLVYSDANKKLSSVTITAPMQLSGGTLSTPNFVGDSGSGGTAGLVPAPAAGDAAASKFLKADGTWTAPSGSGDVVGPASAVDSRIAAFDGTTGKLLKDGGSTIANVLDRSNHTGTQLLSTISDKGTLPDWSLLTTNMLRTVTNNFAVKLDTGSTSAIDMNLASSTNVLAGALTIAHATNGISGYERTHVRWLWAGGSDRTLTIPTSWKTNVYSAVPASITNGTITKMYVTTIGDTSTAANQTNVFVSFEFYK